jgi:crotonobetainyl-CoA:carnitine CoA-transferase CaiB-like acyl-CoA transferase
LTGPLANIRVVDLTAIISGPYATQLLGDQGADVIKVETGVGDLIRHATPAREGMSAAFLSCNRNKRSITLDLKSDEGKAALRKLIATADVFVQNFRPGAIERMGFGEDAVRELRPDIVYVSISGFGESGPYTHKRVYDPVIQALSGCMHAQGGAGKPRLVNTVLPDKLTAVTAAQAITAALVGRERTGQGEHVRLSMLDATVAWLWPDAMINYTLLGDGVSAPLAVSQDNTALETQDGYIVAFIASDVEWQGFARAADKPELVDDPRFKTLQDRMAHFSELGDVMRAIVRSGTTEEWLTKLDDEQVPCAQVNDVEAVMLDKQIQANELIVESEHDIAGTNRLPRPAARFEQHVIGEPRPAPSLGEHTAEILAELGLE